MSNLLSEKERIYIAPLEEGFGKFPLCMAACVGKRWGKITIPWHENGTFLSLTNKNKYEMDTATTLWNDVRSRYCLFPASLKWERGIAVLRSIRRSFGITRWLHGDEQYISYYVTMALSVLGKRKLGFGTMDITSRTQYQGNVKDAHCIISMMMIDGEGYTTYLLTITDIHWIIAEHCSQFNWNWDKMPMTGVDEEMSPIRFYPLSGEFIVVYHPGSSN